MYQFTSSPFTRLKNSVPATARNVPSGQDQNYGCNNRGAAVQSDAAPTIANCGANRVFHREDHDYGMSNTGSPSQSYIAPRFDDGSTSAYVPKAVVSMKDELLSTVTGFSIDSWEASRILLKFINQGLYSTDEYQDFLSDNKVLAISMFDSSNVAEIFPPEVLSADVNCLKLMSLKFKLTADIQSRISSKISSDTRRNTNRISQEATLNQLRCLPFSIANISPTLEIPEDEVFLPINISALLQKQLPRSKGSTVDKLYAALRVVLIHATRIPQDIQHFSHCIGTRPARKYHQLPQPVAEVIKGMIMQLPGFVGVYEETTASAQTKYPNQWLALGRTEDERVSKHNGMYVMKEKLEGVMDKLISTSINSVRRCSIEVIQHPTYEERRLSKRSLAPENGMNHDDEMDQVE